MARKRFQKGHVRLRNTTNPYWEGFYWEDLRLSDNRVVRKQRAINLGRSTEISSKKLAERKLAEKLAEVNDIDYRPRPVATVRDFVDMRYRKLILPRGNVRLSMATMSFLCITFSLNSAPSNSLRSRERMCRVLSPGRLAAVWPGTR